MGMPGLRYDGRFLMRGMVLSADGPPKIRPIRLGKEPTKVRCSETSAPSVRNELYLQKEMARPNPLLES